MGDGLCGSAVPSKHTESWRLDFLLFRWNDVNVVLAKLSLSLHVLRYSIISAMSVVSASTTMWQLYGSSIVQDHQRIDIDEAWF